MAYDEALADRIRRVLGPRTDVTEKRMFGGVAFLVDGKMFCGVAGDELMARVGPENYASSLARAHVRPMDFTGRPLKGYVFVGLAALKTSRSVGSWVDRCLAFVETIEKKSPKKRRAPAR